MNTLDITNRTISAFTMYKFLDGITKPFEQFDAYISGAIDREGNFTEEPTDIPTFELFLIYIKKLLNQIPNPSTKSRLNNLTSAMSLFRESLMDYDLDADFIIEGIMQELLNQELIVEQEAAAVHANSMGGTFSNPQVGEAGNIAGPIFPIGHIIRRRKKNKKDSENKV
tara:strand:+ start:793 stop:1299 length:507 start_codon:yes stop_codon:yes gene_type:complete